MTKLYAWLLLTIAVSLAACKKNKEGCTDLNASNYSANAATDDGSCGYPPYPVSLLGLSPGCTNCASLTVMKTYTSAISSYPMAFAHFIVSGDMLASAGKLQLRTTNQVGTGNANDVLDFSKTLGSYALPIESDVDLDKFFFEWSASGSSKWPAFTLIDTVYGNIPDLGTYSGATSFSASADYTFTMNNVVNCDSVRYELYGPNGQVLKTEPGNAFSCTFTAAELNQVGEGTAQLLIRGMKETPRTVNGRVYALKRHVLRSVSSLTITL